MNKPLTQSETFERHIEVIISECLKLDPVPISIILYGSFGRDEGSWYRDDNGNWIPYNDYDICIVSRIGISRANLRKSSEAIGNKIGIRWVDLGIIHPEELPKLRSSILNYDLRNASKVIFGDPTITNNIPEINRKTLPTIEIQTLFFTRLYTLIGSLGEKGIDNILEGEESRFFRNQMAKAILAVDDILLLLKGEYISSYRKRIDKLAELSVENDELLKISQWALEEKLHPQATLMQPEEVRTLYALVNKLFFNIMYRGLSTHFKRTVNVPEKIEYCLKWRPIAQIKRLYWIVRFRNLRMENQLTVHLAQSYIAASWSPEGINDKLLSRGIRLLSNVDRHIPQQTTWNKARLEAARLRMEV